MKTIKLLILSFLTLSAGHIIAQEDGESKQDTRKAIRVAIITEKLDLTEEESKAFWPIYDQMIEDHKTLRKNFAKTKEKGKKMDELTDEEVEQIINESFDFKQKELDLKKKYHTKLKEVLPIKKIAKLYHLEKRINEEMRARMRENRPRPPHRR